MRRNGKLMESIAGRKWEYRVYHRVKRKGAAIEKNHAAPGPGRLGVRRPRKEGMKNAPIGQPECRPIPSYKPYYGAYV